MLQCGVAEAPFLSRFGQRRPYEVFREHSTHGEQKDPEEAGARDLAKGKEVELSEWNARREKCPRLPQPYTDHGALVLNTVTHHHRILEGGITFFFF